ncbi:MAG: phytoene/squalene synthase family protein [Chloroflexi bacterium]|nr:phytoene/squalene synthase family protein [Chloroflexota bacterium]
MDTTTTSQNQSAAANPSVREAYEYCRQVTKTQAKNFYFAFLPLPKAQRHAIYAVYAFSRFSDDYSDEARPVGSKRELLEAHRRRLHEAYAGRPGGHAFVALADAVQRYRIPRDYFDAIIDGVLMDLSISRYETFDDLRQYCYKVASVVGLICIEIFGYHGGDEAKQHAIDLGYAMQLVNIMRDVKEDAERDRIYIPQAELRQCGYSEADLRAGVVNDAFRSLMRFQAERARGYFASGGRLLPLVPRRTRVCPAVLRGLYSNVLDRIEARGYDVYQGRVSLPARQKLLLAGRLWLTTTLGPTPRSAS